MGLNTIMGKLTFKWESQREGRGVVHRGFAGSGRCIQSQIKGRHREHDDRGKVTCVQRWNTKEATRGEEKHAFRGDACSERPGDVGRGRRWSCLTFMDLMAS